MKYLYVLVKIINRTANLIADGSAKSSGVWQTAFVGSELSDQLLYNRRGEYHRYLPQATVLKIALNENHFYVENYQEPIARQSEANFHTFLFVSLSLELFCLTFLIFKLLVVPLFRLLERRLLQCVRIEPSIEQIDDNNNINDDAVSDVTSIHLTPSSQRRTIERQPRNV